MVGSNVTIALPGGPLSTTGCDAVALPEELRRAMAIEFCKYAMAIEFCSPLTMDSRAAGNCCADSCQCWMHTTSQPTPDHVPHEVPSLQVQACRIDNGHAELTTAMPT